MTNEEYEVARRFEKLTENDPVFQAAIQVVAAKMVTLTENYDFAFVEVEPLVQKKIKVESGEELRRRRQQPPPSRISINRRSGFKTYGVETGRFSSTDPNIKEFIEVPKVEVDEDGN